MIDDRPPLVTVPPPSGDPAPLCTDDTGLTDTVVLQPPTGTETTRHRCRACAQPPAALVSDSRGDVVAVLHNHAPGCAWTTPPGLKFKLRTTERVWATAHAHDTATGALAPVQLTLVALWGTLVQADATGRVWCPACAHLFTLPDLAAASDVIHPVGQA